MGVLDELLREVFSDRPDGQEGPSEDALKNGISGSIFEQGGIVDQGRVFSSIGNFVTDFFTNPDSVTGPAALDPFKGMTDEEKKSELERMFVERLSGDPVFNYLTDPETGELTPQVRKGIDPILSFLSLSGDKEETGKLYEDLLSREKDTGIPISLQAMIMTGDSRAEGIAESLGLDLGNIDGGGGGGGGGGGIFQSGTDVTLPPLVALLQEMSTRTNNDRTAASNQLTSAQAIAGQLAPGGDDQNQFFPGGAPGGLMDIFGGILSGQGAKGIAAGNDPFAGMRQPGVLPIEVQKLLERVGAKGPSISEDTPMGLDVAKRIFESAMLMPRFSSSGGFSSGGGDDLSTAGSYIDSILG